MESIPFEQIHCVSRNKLLFILYLSGIVSVTIEFIRMYVLSFFTSDPGKMNDISIVR